MTSSTSITPFTLGAYPNAADASSASDQANFQTNYNSFTTLMGVAPSYLDYFTDYTQPVSDWVSNASWQAWSAAQTPSAASATPVIALPMYSTASGALTPDQQYQAIISGADDGVLTGIVNAWVAQGFKTLAFRPGWEMNLTGNTYAGDTAQDQSDWVAAFQHIYTVLHQAAAAAGAAVTVIWNPSTTNYSNAEAITNLYPGNAYVDAIGADAYSDINPYSDTTSGAPEYHDWDTGGEDTSTAQFIADPINRDHYWSYPAATEWSNDSSGGHSLSLTALLQFAQQQGKPFDIPETGAGNSNSGTDVADDAAFPQWLAQQLTAAQAAGTTIGFVNLWDSNGGGNYEFSNASDNKPLEAAAWAKYFGAQTSTSDPTTSTPAPAVTTPAVTAPAVTTPAVTTPAVVVPAVAISVTASGQTTSINGSSVGTTTVSGDTFVLANSGIVTATLGSTSSTIAFTNMSGIMLSGGTAKAIVTADGGTNTFTAGMGALEVTGGSGADAYVFHAQDGSLTVDDFSLAKGDTLTIDRNLRRSMHETSDGSGGTLLTFHAGSDIDLKGVSSLSTNNILWK